jgi:hypothetical protein
VWTALLIYDISVDSSSDISLDRSSCFPEREYTIAPVVCKVTYVRGSNPSGGARFSAQVQTGPGAHPASYAMGTASFPGVKLLRCSFDYLPI